MLQSPNGWHSYFATDDHDKKVVACIHFHLHDGIARSPFRSPFGALEFHHTIPLDVLYEFIRFFEIRLKSKGAKGIVIKQYSEAYAEKQSTLLNTFLVNQHYAIVQSELDAVIDVNGHVAEENFHHSEKKRLARALESGLQFRTVSIDEFDKVYEFIQDCRQEKQYALSMAMQELKAVIKVFPDRVKLFGVFLGDEWAAASISVRVRQDVLYDFYHDHMARFDNLSPVVLLVTGIYEYCQREGIQLIDLGTSTTNTLQPNFGLLRFKKNLGARYAAKLTFEKALA